MVFYVIVKYANLTQKYAVIGCAPNGMWYKHICILNSCSRGCPLLGLYMQIRNTCAHVFGILSIRAIASLNRDKSRWWATDVCGAHVCPLCSRNCYSNSIRTFVDHLHISTVYCVCAWPSAYDFSSLLGYTPAYAFPFLEWCAWIAWNYIRCTVVHSLDAAYNAHTHAAELIIE